jgi:multidrug efflux pump subunit AcrA (membrane-fusion protein)
MYFTTEQAERAKLVNTIKKQNTTEKEKQKLSAAELAAKKKQAELDELKKKFDVDRINLETALANSKDEAEKARIRSLLTIMDEDVNSAAKRMAELDTANAAKMKAELAAAESLRYLAQEAARAGAGLASIGNPSGVYNYTPSAPSFVYGAGSVPDLPGLSNMPDANAPIDYGYTAANPSFTYSPPMVNNITINTPVGTEDYLTEAMQRALQKLNRYGDSTTFAGAL